VRNDTYWAEPPLFERMTLSWAIGAADRLRAWQDGEIDLLWPVRADDLDRIGNRPARLYTADAASVMFAAFNFDNPARAVSDLFEDVHIRQALSLAIDRERYTHEVFAGFTRFDAAGTIAQPWAHDFAITNPRRDLDAARELLRRAGWEKRDSNGTLINLDGNLFTITAILRKSSRPELGRVLSRVARDLAEIGIRLEVQALSEDAFQERWLGARDFDLIAYAYDLYPGFTDFDLYGSAWDSRINPRGWNPGGYKNDAVDEAIAEALVSYDIDAQRKALRRLQQAANDDLFGLWLGFPQDLVLVAADIEGYQPNKVWQTAETRRLWRRG
jgi:peptide/nickel transport system substrate-binding protein